VSATATGERFGCGVPGIGDCAGIGVVAGPVIAGITSVGSALSMRSIGIVRASSTCSTPSAFRYSL
jgi:hypothetical protein